MDDISTVLRECVSVFDRLSLPYAVMGGLAARVHGIPRPTYDVDFTIIVPRQRLAALYDELEEAGFTVPEAYRGGWVDEVAGLPLVKFRLFIGDRGIDADVFLAETPYQEEVIRRARRERIGGLEVSLATPEDLILLKLMADRPRDRADIADIRFIQGDLDEAYMRRWADELGFADRLEDVLSEPPL